jgi:predicted dienelactone hydrolase
MTRVRAFSMALALVWLACLAPARAAPQPSSVGMEQVSAAVADDAAVAVTVWYPSTSAARVQTFGPFTLEVAVAGEPATGPFPLIVMSHGTGGSALGLAEIGVPLAKAGFVVAAVEHAGDNYRDRSRSFARANFLSRPHQISAAIDFLLSHWRHKDAIDPARIGLFGHSAGGTTALIVGGGAFDWRNVVRYCVEYAEDWGCRQERRQAQARTSTDGASSPVEAADPRVKALVLAAPALAHGFAPNGLAQVRLPVQLWVAGRDNLVTDAERVAVLLPKMPDRHALAGAGHFSFLPPCSDGLRAMAPEICADPPGFDRGAFQQEFTKAMIRFFRKHLRR